MQLNTEKRNRNILSDLRCHTRHKLGARRLKSLICSRRVGLRMSTMKDSEIIATMEKQMEEKENAILLTGNMDMFMDHHLDAKQFRQQAALYPQEMLTQYNQKWWPELSQKKKCVKQGTITGDFCQQCETALAVDAKENVLVCLNCGLIGGSGIDVSFMTVKKEQLIFNGNYIAKKHIYNRLVIYKRTLQQIQGQSNLEPYKVQINKLCEALDFYVILRPKDVVYQVKQMRLYKLRGLHNSICKKYDKSKTYNPPTLTHEQYLMHIKTFIKLEVSFMGMRKRKLTTRKNFISYTYLFMLINDDNGWGYLNCEVETIKADTIKSKLTAIYKRALRTIKKI